MSGRTEPLIPFWALHLPTPTRCVSPDADCSLKSRAMLAQCPFGPDMAHRPHIPPALHPAILQSLLPSTKFKYTRFVWPASRMQQKTLCISWVVAQPKSRFIETHRFHHKHLNRTNNFMCISFPHGQNIQARLENKKYLVPRTVVAPQFHGGPSGIETGFGSRSGR